RSTHNGEAQDEGRETRLGCREEDDAQEELFYGGYQPHRSGIHADAWLLRARRLSSHQRRRLAPQAPLVLRRREPWWESEGIEGGHQVAEGRLQVGLR